MFKILDSIDNISIISAYFNLEKDLVWTEYGHKGKQTGLQHKVGEDPWTSAVGKGREQETEFNVLNPFFSNTIFESLIDKYQLTRTRLMWLNPFACYSLHLDDSERVHIPLITNSDCLFIFSDISPFHLPVGHAYVVDTRKKHSFANFSDKPRLHLVGNL